MATLIIGGSSQLAFYIIKSINQGDSNQIIYATFRSQKSYNQQMLQLHGIKIPCSNLVPIFIQDFDRDNFIELLNSCSITQVFYLAAVNLPSGHPSSGFMETTYKVHVQNSLDLLEALTFFPKIKSIFTLSSKMFSVWSEIDRVIGLDSVADPESIYGKTKLLCWENIKKFRCDFGIEAHGVVLFNFESNYRLGDFRNSFVIHKIANDLVQIKNRKTNIFSVERLFDRTDWSHAEDICESIMSILNTTKPRDYVIGSGIGLSLAEIIIEALKLIGDPLLEDYCLELIGENSIFRPCLVADNFEARKILNYKQTKSISNVIYSSFINKIGVQ